MFYYFGLIFGVMSSDLDWYSLVFVGAFPFIMIGVSYLIVLIPERIKKD